MFWLCRRFEPLSALAVPCTQFQDELGSMAGVAENLRDSAAEKLSMEQQKRDRIEAQALKEKEQVEEKLAARLALEAERAQSGRLKPRRIGYWLGASVSGGALWGVDPAALSRQTAASVLPEYRANRAQAVIACQFPDS